MNIYMDMDILCISIYGKIDSKVYMERPKTQNT